MRKLNRCSCALERDDGLLASDEEGRDHVRKYDDVAQRQHRIGPGFTWRKRWTWLCSGHGPKSVLLSLSAATRLCAVTTECDGPGKEYGPPQRYPRPKGKYDTLCPFSRPHPSKKNLMIPGAFGSEIAKIPPMDDVLRRHSESLLKVVK